MRLLINNFIIVIREFLVIHNVERDERKYLRMTITNITIFTTKIGSFFFF